MDSLVTLKHRATKTGPRGMAMQVPKAELQVKQRRKKAGNWLKELRVRAGLSQIELAQALGVKYYTFISQVENGFGRVPTDSMETWARALNVEPSEFARELLVHYEPELYRLLFEVKK
jgi:DNA-binding XRE family transcriptional regulator